MRTRLQRNRIGHVAGALAICLTAAPHIAAARLLLARLFARPANVLVLDEPTNDLDLETLELLEAQLVEWPGTLLLASHDRVFLDNLVTSTLVFEGDGRVQEYVGGYEDWLRQRSIPSAEAGDSRARAAATPGEGRMRQLKSELIDAYARWDELDSRAK
jgi:ATP-binding cassette subfamily F protein uup